MTLPADIEDHTYEEAFRFIRLNISRLRSYELLWILERWDYLNRNRRTDDRIDKEPANR